MDNAVEQIKQKLDVVEVLSEYIKLTKAGRNWKGRCPFHAERTPSFMVSQEKQMWHCFGCGAGGDIFKFVMQMEGLEFPDALRLLARRAGVVLKKQDPKVQSQKKRLFEICELAAKFFEVQLQKTSEGKKALDYLKKRGLKNETIKEWRLGWAHDKWRALHDFLASRGYKTEEMLQAGLIVASDRDKKYYDRFRSRIMFPIFDLQGQVIAFGGRVFGAAAKKDMAKYVNSPQTPLYDKSNVLYGLHQAKNDIRNQNLCVLVEGYMDLLMSHQAGIKNVVASSGTALTSQQLNIIGRYTKKLAMAFDADLAGESATRRSIDLALAQDFEVGVISLADKDPADVVLKDPTVWQAAIARAQSVMDFYFTSVFARHDSKTAAGKKEIKNILLPVIKAIASRVERSEWIRELAGRLRADEKDIKFDLEKIKSGGAEAQSQEPGAPQQNFVSRLASLEERLLGLCLACPTHFHKLSELGQDDLENPDLKPVFGHLKKNLKTQKGATRSLEKNAPPEIKLRLDYLSLKIQETWPESDEEVMGQEIEACLVELKSEKIKRQLTALSHEIREAQGGGKTKVSRLLEQFNRLSGELGEIIKNK